jgi:uncharacterized protein
VVQLERMIAAGYLPAGTSIRAKHAAIYHSAGRVGEELMGIEDNRSTALRLIEALSKGIIDEATVTEDVCWWVPGRGIVNKADFGKIAKTVSGLFKSGVVMTIHGSTAEGDRVAIEAEAYGELRNGKIYNNTYHFLFLFRDGRIFLAKEYNDSKHAADVFGGGAF